MSVGDLARYLMVSRQNLSGVLARMERERSRAHTAPAPHDRRSRLVTMTTRGGTVPGWHDRALPKIRRYYEDALAGLLSITDPLTHALHYLVRILENMTTLDADP